MRIYAMTATFGKLENAVLTLEPGLNVITAPNEWGKSTWCAFLLAMLYGLDTRAKSTKTALADKERYAPWSGAPMAGRIDLHWRGRDITIERSTPGRIPLGEFRAYETKTGLDVPELTAANCGQQLLGVEQSVYRRAGFIRHSDLPVTEDEALRRRLNDLVTTGDESGDGDRLAAELKNLKNRVRYNRSGLLPQAKAERGALEEKLAELENLDTQCKKLKMRIGEAKDWQIRLKNHEKALAYRESEAEAARVAQAREAAEQAEANLQRLEAECGQLPDLETAEHKLREVRAFQEEWNALQKEARLIPELPERPRLQGVFQGKSAQEARNMVKKDTQEYGRLLKARASKWMRLIGFVGLWCSLVLIFMRCYGPAAGAAMASLAALLWSRSTRRAMKKQAIELSRKYGGGGPETWGQPIEWYESQLRGYEQQLKQSRDSGSDVEVRLMVLRKRKESLCGAQEPETVVEFWQDVHHRWERLMTARREALAAQRHFEDLAALVKPVPRMEQEDDLTATRAETEQLLKECAAELQRLQNRLGQYQGRMEALGNKEQLEQQRQEQQRRIAGLNRTYAALNVALETLAQARAELQRRFAPRIATRAQTLMQRMTDGRYHSLSMDDNLAIRAGAGEETVLHDILWRSDGTVDQLYLSLRLAVAEELTPKAPLVLDDALVRFDDERMKAAVEILKEMGQKKQIILFTCQGREAEV